MRLLLASLLVTSACAAPPAARFDPSRWQPNDGKSDAPGWPDRLEHIDDWYANATDHTYGITIYYPPSYGQSPDRRYPVVYMSDGQNLFLDDLSFGGISWNVKGAMDDGAADGSIREALVVGVDNSDDRTWAYTPVYDSSEGDGGGADKYLSFLADELKPQIDQHLRTLADRDDTAIIGSSLGGLLSAYAGTARNDVYGLVGVMSPSTWWDNDWILSNTSYGAPWKVYVDSGDAGPSNDDVTETAKLAAGYRAAASQDVELDYVVQHGGQHGEYWWRQRIPGALSFLLGGN
jgi:predicted alpha/beta superfamily hydrolase